MWPGHGSFPTSGICAVAPELGPTGFGLAVEQALLLPILAPRPALAVEEVDEVEEPERDDRREQEDEEEAQKRRDHQQHEEDQRGQPVAADDPHGQAP